MRNKMAIAAILNDEAGFTLVELLSAIVILGIVLPLFMGFIVTNARMIESNTIQTEAIHVREEIREWMSYKAQSQDLADLNVFVLATTGHQPAPISLSETDEIARASHLILDESGIEKNPDGTAKFGESIPAKKVLDDDGNETSSSPDRQLTQQVKYGTSTDFSNLDIAPEIKQYVGKYVGEGADQLKTTFAVLVEAAPKVIKIGTNATNAENYDSGILVTLRIYDIKSGKALTKTQFHWGADV